jgi:hypothetical protein
MTEGELLVLCLALSPLGLVILFGIISRFFSGADPDDG